MHLDSVLRRERVGWIHEVHDAMGAGYKLVWHLEALFVQFGGKK